MAHTTCTHRSIATGQHVLRRSVGLRRASLALLALLAVLAVAAGARAQDPSGSWQQRYERARTALLDEHFEDAQVQLKALAPTAPSESDRRLVLELADLARLKSERRIQQLQPSLRTSDELAVLYTTAVFYGLGSSAWLTLQLQPQTFGGALIPFAVLTSAAVGGVAIADAYRPLRHGIPHAIAAGLYLGFGEGLWLVAYQHAYATEHPGSNTAWHSERVSTVLWAGSTGGALVGALVGAWRRPTPGRVSFTASAGIWTGVLSAFAADALNPDQKGRAPTSYVVGGIGYNAGLLAGIAFGPSVAPSVARVRFIDLAGLGGALLGGGSYALITNQRDSRAGLGAAAIGGALGLGIAWWATSGMAPDRSHDALPSAIGKRSAPAFSLQPTIVPTRGGFVASLVGAM